VGDLTLTALWEADVYDITYVLADGGVNGVGNPVVYTVEDLPLSIDVASKTGYTFLGWTVVYDDGTAPVTVAMKDYVIPAGTTGTVTLTAVWSEAIVYDIEYELDGGINDLSNPATYTVEDDDIVLADPSRIGYVFEGWSPTDTIPAGSTGDKTFTATWEPVAEVSYVVRYLLWETEFPIADDKVVSGQVGDVVCLVPDEFVGYVAVDPTPVSVTLSAEGNVFIFYYLAIPVDSTWYVVHYYLEGTAAKVAADKVVIGMVGDEVTVYAVDVAGYVAVEPVSLSGVLGVGGSNVFVFYYIVDVEVHTFTVTYAPGAQGTFASQPHSGLLYGVATPAFSGTPMGNSGYTFTGWSPSVASAVTGDVTYTAQWTYTGTSTDNNNGGSSGSGSGSSKPKPSPSPAAPTEDPPVEPTPPVIVPPEEPEFTWALLNLVLGVVGVVLAVVLVVLVLLWRNKDQKKVEDKKQLRTLLFLTTIILGIVGIAVFFLTEDMSRTMGWVDIWSIVSVVVFAVEVIALTLFLKLNKINIFTKNNA